VKEYSYWWDTAPEAPDSGRPAALDGTAVDAVIVGAGYTGLAAARQLALAGARVLVLERERVGWGASSRNAGQVLTGLRVEPAALVRRFGEQRAREIFSESLTAIDAVETLVANERIDCDYERTGHLQAAWKPSHLAAFRAEQALLARVFKHSVEIVERRDQASEIASTHYHGLLVDGRSAALNPAKYVHGLAAAACRAGAAIRTGVRVTRLERVKSRWRVATTAGAIDAGDVLAATNGYTDTAAPSLQRRFIPLGSYIIVTAPLGRTASELLPKGRMAFDSKHFLYYFRVTADGRLLFGGRAEFGQPDAARTQRAARILERGLKTVFPQLAGVPVEYAWSGNVAFTRDELPRAGRIDGLWFAGGYGGHGIAMATHLGALIGRRMAGEPLEHPLFDDRLAPIPLYRGTPWFLPFVGAYYRLKDLLE
jgi:glycine/D-amino acid oxidase-like deaminating enzyme